MPPTSSDAQHHASGEEDAPDRRLQDHMDPKDAVDGRMHLLLGEVFMVFVGECTGCDRQEKQSSHRTPRSASHYRGTLALSILASSLSSWSVKKPRESCFTVGVSKNRRTTDSCCQQSYVDAA